MAFFAKHRTIVMLGLGVLAAIGAWWLFTPEETPESLITTEGAESGIDRSVIDTLLTLRAVSLSGTIFAEPAFTTLRDFGTQIIPEPVGRQNPFAPLQGRASSTPRGGQVFDRR